MGQFSQSMRSVADSLIKDFGKPCVLSKITSGVYDPSIGKATEVRVDIPTFCAPSNKVNVTFGLDGQNTNLTAFDTESIMVAWFGQEMDATWEIDGQNITTIMPIEAQGDIIVYTLSVGEK